MKALVTGASGFVGGALCRALCAQGHEVRAMLGPRTHDSPELDAAGAVVVHGDLADPNSLLDAALGCDVLFHCAGESATRAARDALAWINVAGTENTLRAARHAGVVRVVMLSCAHVSLLNRDRLHWKEDAALGQAPLGALARSKLLAEELALQASDRALCVTALRPAWLWGPGDRTNLPALCREAQHGGVRLFGRGDNLFATTYIDNLVDALIAAASAPTAGVGGRAFHVADADALTAREFFTKLCTAVGLPAPRAGFYLYAYAAAVTRQLLGLPGPLPDDVARRARATLLDCLPAIQTFDYHPRITVDEGMQALATWTHAHGGPSTLATLSRPPATPADAARHRHLADRPP